jgi:hypothetical protein
MAVRGGKQVSQALQRIPRAVETRVRDAIQDGAIEILQDMKARTPADTGQTRAALTVRYENEGLTAHIGLPTRDLASDHFVFRFIDSGTRGGEFRAKRRVNGEVQRYTIRVPPRAALNIRQNALAGNIDEVDRLVRAAIREGLRVSR